MFDVKSITSKIAVDCGATCLQMFLAYYGIDSDLPTLTKECETGPTGCSAAAIKRVGIKYGLDVKAYSMSADELMRQDRPAIIHWKGNHFCIFCGMSDKGDPVICNPDRGRYPVPLNSFKTFYGEIALFNGEPSDLPKELSPEERIAELEEKNQMLVDCILEMADIIYA